MTAEATGLENKANAMKQFNSATQQLEVATRLVEVLPQMVAESVKPFEKIEHMNLTDWGSSSRNGRGDGPIDTLINVSPNVLGKVNATLKEILGIDLSDMANGKTVADESSVATAEPETFTQLPRDYEGPVSDDDTTENDPIDPLA